MRFVKILIFGILSFLPAHAFSADQCLLGDVEDEYYCIDKACSDDTNCFSDFLNNREKQMDKLIETTIASYTSMWGEEAVVEGQERIRSAQKAWKEYRNSDCLFGYYTKAPSHPNSGDMKISTCKLFMTLRRISAIKSFENYNETTSE